MGSCSEPWPLPKGSLAAPGGDVRDQSPFLLSRFGLGSRPQGHVRVGGRTWGPGPREPGTRQWAVQPPRTLLFPDLSHQLGSHPGEDCRVVWRERAVGTSVREPPRIPPSPPGRHLVAPAGWDRGLSALGGGGSAGVGVQTQAECSLLLPGERVLQLRGGGGLQVAEDPPPLPVDL